jgi:hypothetical protein
MSNHKNIEVWADEDVVARTSVASRNGQSQIDLFFVDFFSPEQSVMVHMGPKQALEVIEELKLALLDLIGEIKEKS